ncbi:MAG: ATP-binding protein [Calditrichaeota bacterium]|nr:ATP-binding protein [Calditrichota bacterium]
MRKKLQLYILIVSLFPLLFLDQNPFPEIVRVPAQLQTTIDSTSVNQNSGSLPLVQLAYWEWASCLLVLSAFFLLTGQVFIRKIFQPIENIHRGIETVKDDDYTVFLNKSGSNEFSELIDFYNLMIENMQNKRVEIKQMQQFFEDMIRTFPFAVFIITDDELIEYANLAAEKMLSFSLSQMRFKKVKLLDHPFTYVMTDKKISNGQLINFYGKKIKVNRSIFNSLGVRKNLIVLEELTERIAQNEIDSWRKMIRVISHEINNSISPVLSITQSFESIIGKLPELDSDMYDGLKSIQSRLNHLTSFINDYSKVAKLPEVKAANINIDDFFQNLIVLMNTNGNKNGAHISYQNNGANEFIFVDERLFEQAIINIIKNGIEACEGKTAEISITTEKQKIIIQDNGSGIPEEVQDNLFVPYFTTKESGSGIGLSLVQDILTKHRFKFYIESKENQGTRFIINY